MVFYEKELIITGVNSYTRDFLNKMGINVPENELIPDDPYLTYRKEVSFNNSKSRPTQDSFGREYFADNYVCRGRLYTYYIYI